MPNNSLQRIHIFGASGSGTTSLGKEISNELPARFLDSDSYYWKATEPPYTEKNSRVDRLEMIQHDIEDCDGWVLSGSICSWGDPLLHHFTLAVFLHLESSIRMDRLARREHLRYGNRIKEGGDMYRTYLAFMSWAESYDEARSPTRSLDLHESWMQNLHCPILRLDSRRSVNELSADVLNYVGV